MSTGEEPWGYAAEWSDPMVLCAVRSLGRAGLTIKELTGAGNETPCRWAWELAKCVASGECAGGVVFCRDPGLACCVANKLPGLRAVPIAAISQAVRALGTLGANFLAVDLPGRTFFEIKHILTMCCSGGQHACPPEVGCTLRELDGHAHR
jgi:hypothetical protein